MATTELTERDVTKKMLEDAADDMSAVMKFENAIPTGKKIMKAAIQEDVIEAAEELRAEDALKPKTVEVLTALGVKLPAGEESEISSENVSTEEEEGEKEKTPEVDQKTPKKGVTRIQAVGKTLQNSSGVSQEELIAKSDVLYAENGGKANEKEAKWAVKIALDVLSSIDAVVVSADGKYSLA